MAKLLLCCGKAKPYLYYNWNTDTYHVTNSLKDLRGDFGGSRVCSGKGRLCAYQSDGRILTNGHIMVECDFEVEEIEHYIHYEPEVDVGVCVLPEFECNAYRTNTLDHFKLLEKSCLKDYSLPNITVANELDDYLKGKNGYAIHLKNIHVFDKPRELSDFNKIIETSYGEEPDATITKAPQNMMRCCYEKKTKEWKTGVLISIKPEELCRILNGEQDIIVRKKVLKEML